MSELKESWGSFFCGQTDKTDCGPACLQMIAKYYGIDIDIAFLRDACGTNASGTNMRDLLKVAKKLGFDALCVEITLKQLMLAPLPAIIYWGARHFVVLYAIEKRKKGVVEFQLADPSFGDIKSPKTAFSQNWFVKTNPDKGIVLLIEKK